MRMKKPAHPRELVAANLKELGLSVVEAAKAIGVVIHQQLYTDIRRMMSLLSPHRPNDCHETASSASPVQGMRCK